ncbi:MAG: 6-phosphofructokinase [Clostridia bacterium]|nr:6-phosphofructokinase [Clostridia bacterium]
MANAVVGQSGGPSVAINSSLAGVFKGALENPAIDKIYGMVNGLQGLLEEHLTLLTDSIKDENDLELLRRTPASFLGSCRYKLPKLDSGSDVFEKVISILNKYDIKYFFYIGGNDSMDTVMKLSNYAKENGITDIKFVGVPKTIDNDLVATDHTPGFGSAAKYIATTVKEISRDSFVYDTYSVTIIEIMGRNAGWLTAASSLARGEDMDAPDLIYLPECNFDFDKFIDDVKKVAAKKKNVIVTVSEGIHTADGKYVCEAVSSGTADAFGHKYLGGTARFLEDLVRDRLGYKARGIELNIPQRCAAHISSMTDLDEAMQVGIKAVEAAVSGKTGIMMAYVRKSNAPYTIDFEALDVNNIANAEKVIPKEWINADENDVTQDFIDYAYPLIQGEVTIPYKNGLPVHLVLKK